MPGVYQFTGASGSFVRGLHHTAVALPLKGNEFQANHNEGLLEHIPGGFKITYKGRMIIHQGGFRKLHRSESLVRVCSVVAAIAGVIAVVLQVLFQLLWL